MLLLHFSVTRAQNAKGEWQSRLPLTPPFYRRSFHSLTTFHSSIPSSLLALFLRITSWRHRVQRRADLILVLLDWLDAIIEHGLACCSGTAKSVSGATAEHDRVLKLRSTIVALSCVNRGFRWLLSPRVFQKLAFTGKYTQGDLQPFLQALGNSGLCAQVLK